MRSNSKVILSVTNDLETDQRLHKVASSLTDHGYTVQLVGRQLQKSDKNIVLPFSCKRFRLWFNKGPLFYFNYNLSLFFYLLFNKANMLIANDLDTLLANYWIARIKRCTLIYDSHEYFTEVPELINRPTIQAIWLKIEAYILPKLKYAYTVSEKIAKSYNEKYGLTMQVIRNFPRKKALEQIEKEEKTIIYQGALNVERGLEELIDAMSYLDGYKLVIAGNGDIETTLKLKVREEGLEDRVTFLDRVAPSKLPAITQKAKIGVSLEKNAGLSYQYALPNKVFDYIHVGVPVLYSPLEEVVNTLSGYTVGEQLTSHEPELLAEQLKSMMTSENYQLWVDECHKAAETLNWEEEEKKLINLMESING